MNFFVQILFYNLSIDSSYYYHLYHSRRVISNNPLSHQVIHTPSNVIPPRQGQPLLTSSLRIEKNE